MRNQPQSYRVFQGHRYKPVLFQPHRTQQNSNTVRVRSLALALERVRSALVVAMDVLEVCTLLHSVVERSLVCIAVATVVVDEAVGPLAGGIQVPDTLEDQVCSQD